MTNNDIENSIGEILLLFSSKTFDADYESNDDLRDLAYDNAKQSILSLLTEAETRGRLDEIDKYLGAVTMGYSLDEYRTRRIAELSKLQEEQTHE